MPNDLTLNHDHRQRLPVGCLPVSFPSSIRPVEIRVNRSFAACSLLGRSLARQCSFFLGEFRAPNRIPIMKINLIYTYDGEVGKIDNLETEALPKEGDFVVLGKLAKPKLSSVNFIIDDVTHCYSPRHRRLIPRVEISQKTPEEGRKAFRLKGIPKS